MASAAFGRWLAKWIREHPRATGWILLGIVLFTGAYAIWYSFTYLDY